MSTPYSRRNSNGFVVQALALSVASVSGIRVGIIIIPRTGIQGLVEVAEMTALTKEVAEMTDRVFL